MPRTSIKQKIILCFVLIQVISIISGLMGIERLHSLRGLVDEALHATTQAEKNQASAHATDIYGQAEIETYGFIGLIAVWIYLSQYLLGKLIARPVGEITQSMRDIAAGKLNAEIPGIGRSDEIGEMAKTVEVFKQNAVQKMRLVEEQARRDEEASAEKIRLMHELAENFEGEVSAVIDALSAAVMEMKGAAESLSRDAGESSQQSTIVAAASEESSVNMNNVASAVERMNHSIRAISEQVSHASQSTEKAEELANASSLVVNGLAESADKINQIVSLITNIAAQTDLLALNATIEAARAGDAGKGFAVVASEVKALATQTSKATSDIAEQINAIQEATNNTVAAMQNIMESVSGIKDTTVSVANAIGQQTDVTNEIARNVQEAATGSSDIAKNIVGVQKTADHTGSAAAKVLDMSNALSERSAALKQAIEGFLMKVRAG
jgi:methyl-accepting chemotaxis protein